MAVVIMLSKTRQRTADRRHNSATTLSERRVLTSLFIRDNMATDPSCFPRLLSPFGHQVAGQTSLLQWDSCTVCKPLIDREHFFYQTCPAELSPFTPQYRGEIDVYAKENSEGSIQLYGKPVDNKAHQTVVQTNVISNGAFHQQPQANRGGDCSGQSSVASDHSPDSSGHTTGSSSQLPCFRGHSPDNIGQSPVCAEQIPVSSGNSSSHCHGIPAEGGGAPLPKIQNEKKPTHSGQTALSRCAFSQTPGSQPADSQPADRQPAHSQNADSQSPSSCSMRSQSASSSWSEQKYQRLLHKMRTSQNEHCRMRILFVRKRLKIQMKTDYYYENLAEKTPQNVVAAVARPCILDLKVGTRQHGDDASSEKIAILSQRCRDTTSRTLGLRLCGLQVYQTQDDKYRRLDKFHGRALTPESFKAKLQEFLTDGTRFRSQLLQPILSRLRRLITQLQGLHAYRFYGSSLLIIYSGNSPGGNDFAPLEQPVLLNSKEYSGCGQRRRLVAGGKHQTEDSEGNCKYTGGKKEEDRQLDSCGSSKNAGEDTDGCRPDVSKGCGDIINDRRVPYEDGCGGSYSNKNDDTTANACYDDESVLHRPFSNNAFHDSDTHCSGMQDDKVYSKWTSVADKKECNEQTVDKKPFKHNVTCQQNSKEGTNNYELSGNTNEKTQYVSNIKERTCFDFKHKQVTPTDRTTNCNSVLTNTFNINCNSNKNIETDPATQNATNSSSPSEKNKRTNATHDSTVGTTDIKSNNETFNIDNDTQRDTLSVDVKMIDFAHTTHQGFQDRVKHQGPDNDYIYGLKNLMRLFQEIEFDQQVQ